MGLTIYIGSQAEVHDSTISTTAIACDRPLNEHFLKSKICMSAFLKTGRLIQSKINKIIGGFRQLAVISRDHGMCRTI